MDTHSGLQKIKDVAEGYLTGGCKIADIVYRPFDMGVYGASGYGLILFKKDKTLDVNFGDGIPSIKKIKEGVAFIVERIA